MCPTRMVRCHVKAAPRPYERWTVRRRRLHTHGGITARSREPQYKVADTLRQRQAVGRGGASGHLKGQQAGGGGGGAFVALLSDSRRNAGNRPASHRGTRRYCSNSEGGRSDKIEIEGSAAWPRWQPRWGWSWCRGAMQGRWLPMISRNGKGGRQVLFVAGGGGGGGGGTANSGLDGELPGKNR